MAPITAASANLAYDKAVTKLKRACAELERHIPPPESLEEESGNVPSLRPRANSIATCPLCARELEELEHGAMSSHVCTHGDQRTDDDNVSTAGSQGDKDLTHRRARNKQSKIGVIKEYMEKLTNCLNV